MKKMHSPEQIVNKLRQADVDLGKGLKVPQICRKLTSKALLQNSGLWAF